MKVSIRDLAAKCNLSVSAVSKALNNYPDISRVFTVLIHAPGKSVQTCATTREAFRTEETVACFLKIRYTFMEGTR